MNEAPRVGRLSKEPPDPRPPAHPPVCPHAHPPVRPHTHTTSFPTELTISLAHAAQAPLIGIAPRNPLYHAVEAGRVDSLKIPLIKRHRGQVEILEPDEESEKR